MKLPEAIERVLLGESLRDIAIAKREQMLADVGLAADEARPTTFVAEVTKFTNQLCRELGERHAGDSRAEVALVRWANLVDEYDAYDSLLANFRDFDGRDALVRRGRNLFPGPLTAHWTDE